MKTFLFIFGKWYELSDHDIAHLIEGGLRLAAALSDLQEYTTPLDMLLDDIETAGLDPLVDELIKQEHE